MFSHDDTVVISNECDPESEYPKFYQKKSQHAAGKGLK